MTDSHEGQVQVWDMDRDEIIWVSPQEAAAGMIAAGRKTYGEGTPGFAVVVSKAVEMLAEHGFTPSGQKIAGGDSDG